MTQFRHLRGPCDADADQFQLSSNPDELLVERFRLGMLDRHRTSPVRGDGLTRSGSRRDIGSPNRERLYWHASTPDWWYAEAMRSPVKRVRFGTTTRVPILSATPARADNPIYADRHLDAISEIGLRAVLGIGPPDPFISHIPTPWSGRYSEHGAWPTREFSDDDAIANSVDVMQRWHGGADGRIRIALAIAYLFGRRTVH